MTTDNLINQGGGDMDKCVLDYLRQIQDDGHRTREAVSSINNTLGKLEALLEERTKDTNRRLEHADNRIEHIEDSITQHALQIQSNGQAINDLKNDLERDAIKKKDMLDRQQARNNFIFAVMGIILTILTGLAMPILIYLLTK